MSELLTYKKDELILDNFFVAGHGICLVQVPHRKTLWPCVIREFELARHQHYNDDLGELCIDSEDDEDKYQSDEDDDDDADIILEHSFDSDDTID